MATIEPVDIEIRNAAFGYRGRIVIDGVSLTIKRGEFLAVLGPNGGGKTTLLRGLLGILKPVRGEVCHKNGGNLIFGYVPQRESLDPIWPLTAMEVTLMGAFARQRNRIGLPLSAEEKQLAVNSLDRVNAAHLGRMLFSELSGGQKQRVLIARALMTKPNVLLLDEPASGLDVSAQHELVGLLEKLRKEDPQLTIVMISHHLAGLEKLADSVAWVHGGAVEFGPASTMLSDKKIHTVFFE